MSKWSYKNMVSKAIKEAAFLELTEDCKAKSKTVNLQYKKFEVQNYMNNLIPIRSK